MDAPRRVVVDTDAGSDDALALLLLGLSDRVEIDAVTTVAGNAPLDRVLANARHTLDVLGLDGAVPVHEGAAEPLDAESETAEDVHGEGGFGDLYPDPADATTDEGAVERLCRGGAGDGPTTLLCLGPLTNVARALERDPDLGARYDEVVVMGGACNALGNVTAATEFNFWFDPHAARRALRELDVTLVDWGVAVRDGVLDDDLLDRVAATDAPFAEFFTDVSADARAFSRERHGVDGGIFADALAATVVLAPDVATGERRIFVDVDDRAGMTRGYTLADVHGVHEGDPRTTVVTHADTRRFRAAVAGALLDGDPDPALAGDHHDVPPLVERARVARGDSYAPYSEYRVGAALRTADGAVFTGCNVENANYSNSLHAEELALGAAVQAGHRSFDRLAVSSATEDGITPCGMCRQSLAEFCDESLGIVCDEGDGVTEYTLGELLPAAMGPETLGHKRE
jgi:purine nucleosidase